MVAVDSDRSIEETQAQFTTVTTLVRRIEAGGVDKKSLVKTNLNQRLPQYGFSPFVLLAVTPLRGDPYFQLQVFEEPVDGRTDEEIYPLIEASFEEAVTDPSFVVRRGRVGFYPDGIGEIHGQAVVPGSASAIEAALGVIVQKPSETL